MTFLILTSITTSLVLLLPGMSQPLSLGLIVMLSTFFLCLISALYISSWYGYILFLIYVGGLLVMFAYVAALSPNIMFKSSGALFVGILSAWVLIVFIMKIKTMISGKIISNSEAFLSSLFMKFYSVELVSPIFISVLIGLALVLLVNLIVVVKICFYNKGSLRSFSAEYA
uniref:NADH-ubiquinone oxidoreductase chain 6 n=1 Tax=Obscurella hidalgoi TaxID=1663726 RepID=A0A0M3MZ29_OBSHI|nr:NADH dehydrogenase subunit 6 [Obscurella hidalgoi]AKL90683.1 NADH dehydrogenase subunit 6 [Obscurella hidalgoi]